MEVKDLSKEELLRELVSENEKIITLKKQRSGLDGQLDTEYLRKNEILSEIVRRYEND
jgi:hypothetical protein